MDEAKIREATELLDHIAKDHPLAMARLIHCNSAYPAEGVSFVEIVNELLGVHGRIQPKMDRTNVLGFEMTPSK